MKRILKKRGQKLLNRFSRATVRAGEEGKEHIKENLVQRLSHIENIRLLVLEWGLLVLALVLLSITQSIWFEETYSENSFGSGGNYTEATLGNVNSLNPLFAATNSERVLSRLLFATISTNDFSGHPGIGLAESILPSNEGKTWTLRLRDGLKWSDGEDITNQDVLFTLNLIKNPAVDTNYDANLANVNFYENENGEIVFNLPSAYADFISALNIPVVPKHELEDADPKTLLEDDFSNVPVTSGAFSFNALQTSTNASEKIYYLSNNPSYYKGEVLLNSFSVHTYETKNDIIGALNGGVVTATAELTNADQDSIISNKYQKKNSSLNMGAYAFFNMSSPKFKNIELRRAIREGIDLNSIRGVVPDASKLDYPLLDSQITITSYPDLPAQNKEAAASKISEISGDDPISIELVTINSGNLPEVARAFSNELEGLGIKANLSIYEESQEFINAIIAGRNYDILIYETELGSNPDLLPYYHSSQASNAGLNLSNYRNGLVDDLLLGARETMDDNLRAKKYETFLEYWVRDVPAIGIYQTNLTYYYDKGAKTYGNDIRLVTALDRFADIEDWSTVTDVKNKTP